ncbi:hypothetical protein [Burkholderia gladioli]|uniref:hypothetical protein n=1 Tax=Burkholderia gladioli TaxID=28095 RepID=UPI0021B3973E|nr:hypothetical protein [Burkholderia gladioli]
MLDEIRPADAHEASPSTSMAGRAAAPATQATPPVLARLREATGEQHELLHGLMPLAAPSPRFPITFPTCWCCVPGWRRSSPGWPHAATASPRTRRPCRRSTGAR